MWRRLRWWRALGAQNNNGLLWLTLSCPHDDVGVVARQARRISRKLWVGVEVQRLGSGPVHVFPDLSLRQVLELFQSTPEEEEEES